MKNRVLSRQDRQRTALCVAALLGIAYAYFYQGGGWNQNTRFALVRAIVEQGTLRQIVRSPIHPYAKGLLASTVHGAKRGQRLGTIPGTPPSLDKAPHNCSFAPRCGAAQARCVEAMPPNVEIEPGRVARCILAERAESVAAT